MEGWIKLHRKIAQSAVFSDPELLRLWLLCLTKAAHKETIFVIDRQQITLQPGEFVTGRKSLTDDYNMGLKPRHRKKDLSLWRDLKFLEECGNLNIKTTNKYSVISIPKWSEYQENEQQMNNNRTTDEQQMNTNKNVKNEKNKRLYGDHVQMTEDQHQKLINDFGQDVTTDFIDRINYWFSQKPERMKNYKDHYLMVRKWKREDDKRRSESPLNKEAETQQRRAREREHEEIHTFKPDPILERAAGT